MSPKHIGSEEFPAADAAPPSPAVAIRWRAKLLQGFALVLFVTAGTPVLGADTGAALHALPAVAQPNAAAGDEEDDDDTSDYPDDGSGALGNGSRFPVPRGLLPISPTEEKGLLGNWGDAAAEAED